MTHVVFKTPLSLDDMLARFESVETRPDADTIIKSLHSYRGDNVVMFEMFTHEPTIDQHFALVVSPRENDNEYTLKVGTLGYPRHTPGLQKSVAVMGDWLVRLHPDAVIVHHKLGEY